MGQPAEQQAILGAGRLGLRAVDDNRPDAPAAGHRPQLARGREVGAAPAAQAAALDLLDQLVGRDVRQRAVDPAVGGQRHRAAAGLEPGEHARETLVAAVVRAHAPPGEPDSVPVTVLLAVLI